VAVAVSVGEVGADEESTEVVVGVDVEVSAGAVVGVAVSVGLTVGEAVVSGGGVEVSVTGAAASVVVADSVLLAVVLGTVAVAVSVAVARGSLMAPPFQSIAIRFAIFVTPFLPSKSTEITRVGAPSEGGRCPRAIAWARFLHGAAQVKNALETESPFGYKWGDPKGGQRELWRRRPSRQA
jgi:hypothetical protein